MGSQVKPRKAYEFLKQHSTSKASFTVADLMRAAGWSKSTVRTYISKQYRDVLDARPDGTIKVKAEFQRMSLEEFLQLTTQKRKIFATYERIRFQEVVSYEFLLPLTREDFLRKALDDLFYEDAVRQRISEIGLSKLEKKIDRISGETDEFYIKRICGLISEKFAGYSISHVNGRYRATDLTSREQAAKMLIYGERYIIDETTAAVRFIIPIENTKISESFDEIRLDVALDPAAAKEISLIHFIFFNLFVETVVRNVKGEDAIWLLEETSHNRSLYVWSRS
jgi:hypothetical protein